jgi:crotonobetainyl-CoA:carnitine CoA-transferase CaiB-like acyl-CoA transferase
VLGPLEGVRVVELANGIHGPYASMILADLGADVIKIEAPTGDLNRAAAVVGDRLKVGSQFYACNRNKRVMCLDLHKPEGLEIAQRLIEQVDVLVENMRPGVLDRLGLGYEHLSTLYPELVYGSASGYGPRGPRAQLPSLDIVGQAAGGLVAYTGTLDTGPLPVGAAVADHAGAVWLALGIIAALFARQQTGRGQHVQSSLLGSQLSLQAWELSHFLLTGVEPEPAERSHPLARGAWRIFHAADGWFALGGVTEPRWPKLCTALRRDDLREDPRFATDAARKEHTLELIAVLSEAFATWPLGELIPALDNADQVAAAVATYSDIVADPQVLTNDYITELHDPTFGPLRMVGMPVHFTDTPGSIRSRPPDMDEHTAAVLSELGYGSEGIADLFSRGIAGASVHAK